MNFYAENIILLMCKWLQQLAFPRKHQCVDLQGGMIHGGKAGDVSVAVGVWNWWRSSRSLCHLNEVEGSSPSYSYWFRQRTHPNVLKIGWSNWICWGQLNTYFQPFILMLAGFSILSARRKTAQNTHFT